MSRHNHLSVYNSCYIFSKEVFKIQLKLPKNLKYTLGQELFSSAIRCLKGVVVANGSTSKARALDEITLEINVIWMYLRLLHDLGGISKGEYENLSERVAEITPQIAAWKKWDKQKKPS